MTMTVLVRVSLQATKPAHSGYRDVYNALTNDGKGPLVLSENTHVFSATKGADTHVIAALQKFSSVLMKHRDVLDFVSVTLTRDDVAVAKPETHG